MIISGFAGIGKTTLSSKSDKFIDLESSNFRWINTEEQLQLPIEKRKGLIRDQNPEWPENYVNEIIRLNNEGFNVLISMDFQVRQILKEKGIDFILVYPSKESKQNYIDRLINRGNNENFIEKIKINFEQWIDDLDNQPQKKVRLKENEYLLDVVDKLY